MDVEALALQTRLNEVVALALDELNDKGYRKHIHASIS